MKLLYLRYRSMGKFYFVVPVMLFLLLPLVSYLLYGQGNMVEPVFATKNYMSQFAALSSFWWLCMSAKEECDGKGKELIVLYMKSPIRRLVCDFSTLFWQLIHLCAVLGIFVVFVDRAYLPMLWIAPLQAVFVWALAYFLLGVFRTTAMSIMGSIGVVFFCYIALQNNVALEPFVIFGSMTPAKVGCMAVVSLVLATLGFLLLTREYKS